MKNFSLLAIILVLGMAFVFTSCGGTRVARVAPDTQIDLSGRWNATDSQLVAEEMIRDVLSRPWIGNFTSANNRQPVVVVGEVRNRSSEHIETLIFTRDLERELINSGRVRFVASSAERPELRAERMDQQLHASAESMRRLGQELGADFLLTGVITTTTDQLRNRRVIFYQTNMELTNLETNERVWIGQKRIMKDITQPRRRI